MYQASVPLAGISTKPKVCGHKMMSVFIAG